MRLSALRITVAGCCLAVCSGGTPPIQSAYLRGAADLDQKSYAKAEQELAQAESEEPGKTNALALRAKALLHLGRFAEAEQCLHGYLARHPGSADANYLLGYVYFRQNDPRHSLATYTAAARLQKPTADDLKIVGLDYVLMNDYADAQRWQQQAVAADPLSPEAHYYLGRTYYVENSFEKAIAEFEEALRLDPSFGKAENNLGLAYAATNRLEDAERAYRKTIQMEQKAGPKSLEPYLNLAELLSHTPRHSEALQLLADAERVGVRSSRTEEVRGRLLLEDHRASEAEVEFRAALAERPGAAALHFLLGRSLKQQGRVAEAEQEFAQTKTLMGAHAVEGQP